MAFYIADLEKSRKLSDLVRQTVVASSVEGLSYDEFVDQFDEKVLNKVSRARLKLVYRNNLSNASNQAKRYEAGQSKVSNYLIYDAVDDENTRPGHAALDGLVAKADDPVWDDILPPNGHNCRCRVITATERQAQRVKDSDTNEFKTTRQKLANSEVEEDFSGRNTYGNFTSVIESVANDAVETLPAYSRHKQQFRSALAKIPFKVENWYNSVSDLFKGE